MSSNINMMNKKMIFVEMLQLCNIFICSSWDDLIDVILSSNLILQHTVCFYIFKTDDDLKWLESLLTIFHLFPLKIKS
ncbi:hypothetical protein Avbf_17044 [Armadillidium vulgare]|nr:hypothetical protein Avbf_17044 [Armadillidium vulgare]